MEKVLSKFHFIFRHFAYLFDDRENDDWLILDHPIHVFQREHWDCGIACCAMVLKWLNIPLEELYQHDIATRKSPLWTIDLFLFLIEHSVNADMYTITLGFDTHHSNYDWYLDNFNSETSTSVSDINSRYVAAMERGLPIYTVGTNDITSIIYVITTIRDHCQQRKFKNCYAMKVFVSQSHWLTPMPYIITLVMSPVGKWILAKFLDPYL